MFGVFYGNLGDYNDASLEAISGSPRVLENYILEEHSDLVRTPGSIYRHPCDLNFGAWIVKLDPGMTD